MELPLIILIFGISFHPILSSGDKGIILDETGMAVAGRDPKLLSFLRQIFRKPSSAYYVPKNGETVGTNYNQYFTNADPYNQNQLLSAVGAEKVPSPPILGLGGKEEETSESGINSMNSLFTKLIGEDTSSVASIMSNILNLGTGSMENVLKRVNTFDSLKCIPRLLCQTVAQRQLDALTPTVATATGNPKNGTTIKSRRNVYSSTRDAKTIKFLGVETALEQFMAFLDLVQLKNWSLYPYLKGAYEGSQVKRLDECAERFRTCPFTDQQLVYYFNNYNGGLFQSLRSSAK